MRWNILNVLTSLCIAALVITIGGCFPESPEEKIAQTRARYTIELNSWTAQEPQQEIMAEEAVEETASVMAEAAAVASAETSATAGEEAEEGAEGEEAEEEAGPRTVNVLFDLLVRFEGEEPLPGVTVDLVHADPFGKEKTRTLQWVETAGIRKDEERQVPVNLEVDNYEDGDEFSVEFSEFVPPEKRGDYREFSEAGE